MLTRITKISAAWAMALAVAGCQTPNAYGANNDKVEARFYWVDIIDPTVEYSDHLIELTVDYYSSSRARSGKGIIGTRNIAVPKKRPTNSTIDIEWTIDPYPNAKMPSNDDLFELAFKKVKDQYITYRRSIPYPDYQEVGVFGVYFLPCNEVRVVIDKQEHEELDASNYSTEAIIKKWGVKKCPKL